MTLTDFAILVCASVVATLICLSELRDFRRRHKASRYGYMERIGFLFDPEKPVGYSDHDQACRNRYQRIVWLDKRAGRMPWRLTDGAPR